MTRLFNLESYSDLCTNTNLYAYKSETKTPAAYKSFLDRYEKLGYRSDSLHPPELTVRDELMPLKHLGVNLSEDRDRLYVVGDRINSLSLRNFLRSGEKYIYRSVYHYWNYRQQIANNLDLSKPVIFIDLGSLTSEPYCSLQFQQYPDTDYLIPIIDNRGKVSDDFQLAWDFKAIYNSIYRNLALEILSRNFPQLASNKDTIEHLESYLQKINLFKLANGNSSFIVEVLNGEQIYYKAISLDLELLEQAVVNHIDFVEIDRFTKKYPQYSFVLISEYNFLERFRTALSNSKIFIPENQLAEFPQIWQEKQQQNFPLFGQYLDKIKFQIKRGGEIQWIEVLSTAEQEHIYYEGDFETKRFVARIQDTGQEYFKLKNLYTILPIKINESDYCPNGIPQEYAILHPLAKSGIERELEVKIEFIIKLGSAPDLKVTDRENQYKIEAQLRDRQETVRLLDRIPTETIFEYRRQKNNFIPSSEQLQQFYTTLLPIKNIGNFREAVKFDNNIRDAYKIIHRTNNKTDLFLNLHPNYLSDNLLNTTISNLRTSGLIDEVKKYLKGNYSLTGSRAIEAKNFTNKLIMFIGKTYKLSNSLGLNSFFEPRFVEIAYQKVGSEYFLFLSRVALTEDFQLNYLRLFYSTWINNQPLYQQEKYLWGYSRILLWYFEFNRQTEIDFQEHFSSILEYLKTNPNLIMGYKQNAFLALIYLFTFRDPSLQQQFCPPNSDEYNLAQDVLQQYSGRNESIKLKAVSEDKSLNEYFRELLEGNSSQEEVEGLLQV